MYADFSSPVIANTPGGRLNLFIRVADSLIRLTQNTDNTWSAPQDLSTGPGSAAGGLEIRGKPTLAKSADGRLELIVRTADANLWHIWQTQVDGDWSSWRNMTGEDRTLSGTTISGDVAAQNNADGRIEIFARTRDGNLWHIWQSQPNSDWNQWNNLTTQRLMPRGVSLAGDPFTGSSQNGGINVFALGTDGHLWRIRQQQANGNWSDWENLTVGGPMVPSEDGTAYLRPDGRLGLMVHSRDSDLWYREQTQANGPWSQWQNLTREVRRLVPPRRPGDPDSSSWQTLGVVGRPAVCCDEGGRLRIAIVATDGNLWHLYQLKPDQPDLGSQWENLTVNTRGFLDSVYGHLDGPTAIVEMDRSYGRRMVQLFVVGDSGRLWSLSRPEALSGTWNLLVPQDRTPNYAADDQQYARAYAKSVTTLNSLLSPGTVAPPTGNDQMAIALATPGSGSVKVLTSRDGITWTPGLTQPPASTPDSPATLVMGGHLLLAYLDKGEVKLTRTTNLQQWNSPIKVAAASIAGPALAEYQGTLVIAFPDSNGALTVLYSPDFGLTSTLAFPSGPVGDSTPALAVLGNTVYLVWTDRSDNLQLASRSGFAGPWQKRALNRSADGRPALAVWNNKLYLAFQRPPGGPIELLSTADGTTWSQVSLPSGLAGGNPSLTVYNGRLYLSVGLRDGLVLITSTANADGQQWHTALVTGLMGRAGATLTNASGLGQQIVVPPPPPPLTVGPRPTSWPRRPNRTYNAILGPAAVLDSPTAFWGGPFYLWDMVPLMSDEWQAAWRQNYNDFVRCTSGLCGLEVEIVNRWSTVGWMATHWLEVSEQYLTTLCIPGTHDSLTGYDLIDLVDRTGASTSYEKILELLSLSSSTGLLASFLTLGVSGFMADYVGRVLAGWCTTQDRTFSQQLNDGIRYFDLRFLKRGEDYYAAHGSSAAGFFAAFDCTLTRVINDVKAFLSSPRSREMLILQFRNDSHDQAQKLDMFGRIVDELSPYAYKASGAVYNTALKNIILPPPGSGARNRNVIIACDEGVTPQGRSQGGLDIQEWVHGQNQLFAGGSFDESKVAQDVPGRLAEDRALYSNTVSDPARAKMTKQPCGTPVYNADQIRASLPWPVGRGARGRSIYAISCWLVPAISDIIWNDAVNNRTPRYPPVNSAAGYNVLTTDYYHKFPYVQNCLEINSVKPNP
jgi:hypothetical protein